MYRSREAGVAFANGILADFELLAERVEGLHAGLDEERRLRIECIDGACTRLAEVEEAFSERADELATSLAKCVATLGAQSLQIDDMATQMQVQADDLARRLETMENTTHTGRTVGDLAEQLANCVVGPPSQFAKPGHGADTVAQLQAQVDDCTRCIAQMQDTVAQNDKAIVERANELSTTVAKCVASLGAQSLQLNEMPTQVNAQAGEFARHGADTVARLQSQADDLIRRMAQVESTVALNDKNTLADLGRFHGEVNSIRAATAASARALHETVDLSPVFSRLASVESNVGACALAADVSVLECRLAKTESCMQSVSIELGRKASSADLKLVCDDVGRKASSAELRSSLEPVSNLQLQVSLNHSLIKEFETVLTKLPSSVQTLMTSVKTLERRLDTESERTNACWVSLEKAIDNRIAKNDLDPLSSRMGQLEQATSTLAPLIVNKASLDDLRSLMARTQALEDSCGTNGASNGSENTKLALAHQVTRYEELKSLTENKFNELSSQVVSLVAKTDVTANKHHDRAVDQLVSLISSENLCTKDDMNRQLELFYPKAEMDAIISRVWWRLGQSGTVVDKVQSAWNPKVVGLGCLGAGSLAGFADRPQRPQSAPQRPQSARR